VTNDLSDRLFRFHSPIVIRHQVHLVVAKFTNWSNFVREAWLLIKEKREKWNKRSCFETSDERGCTPMFGAAHRRESA